MKKFKFRLQKLLDLREAAEQEIKNELAELLNKQNAVRMRQQGYRNAIARERDSFARKLREKKASYEDIMTFERFYDSTSRAIDISEQEILSMEDDIQKVRDRLIEASRERKVVEKLKEKKLEEYNYELNREIIKENDDANQKLYNSSRELTPAI